MAFYDEIAGEYDEITGAADRAAPAAAFVDELLRRREVGSAVDAACGSGLYAILLAERGVRAVGADICDRMLDQARRRARAVGAEVQWVRASMQEMAERLSGEFDAVLCMGNSLPHLLTDADLAAAMGAFRRLLRPGGVLALQVLNYRRVLDRGERIVGVDRHGGRLYVRFYDFLAGRVRFNVLAIDAGAERCAHALHSTTLRPYTHADLTAALARGGFADVQTFGDLRWGPFDEAASDMVVVVATAAAAP